MHLSIVRILIGQNSPKLPKTSQKHLDFPLLWGHDWAKMAILVTFMPDTVVLSQFAAVSRPPNRSQPHSIRDLPKAPASSGLSSGGITLNMEPLILHPQWHRRHDEYLAHTRSFQTDWGRPATAQSALFGRYNAHSQVSPTVRLFIIFLLLLYIFILSSFLFCFALLCFALK